MSTGIALALGIDRLLSTARSLRAGLGGLGYDLAAPQSVDGADRSSQPAKVSCTGNSLMSGADDTSTPAASIDDWILGAKASNASRDSQKSSTPQPPSIGPDAWKSSPSGGSPAGSTCRLTSSNCSCVTPANLMRIPTVIGTTFRCRRDPP